MYCIRFRSLVPCLHPVRPEPCDNRVLRPRPDLREAPMASLSFFGLLSGLLFAALPRSGTPCACGSHARPRRCASPRGTSRTMLPPSFPRALAGALLCLAVLAGGCDRASAPFGAQAPPQPVAAVQLLV